MDRPGNLCAPRLAIARDEAFCFLYRENLKAFSGAGFSLHFFSPLHDVSVPPCDALYLPGGYPELYAAALEENQAMRQQIHARITDGLPTVAECGGFLYLHEALYTKEGTRYEMAGVIPGACRYHGFHWRFGYVTLRADENFLLAINKETLKGHEFHYYESDHPGEGVLAEKPGCTAAAADAPQTSWRTAHISPTLYAGFPHLSFAANETAARRFADAAQRYREERAKREMPDSLKTQGQRESSKASEQRETQEASC